MVKPMAEAKDKIGMVERRVYWKRECTDYHDTKPVLGMVLHMYYFGFLDDDLGGGQTVVLPFWRGG